MENYFNKLREKIIVFLDYKNNCTETEKLQMHFALKTISYNLTVTFLILFISYTIGSFKETFLLFCIFGILRIIAGGYHFNHIVKCIIATVLIMTIEGKAAQIIQVNLVICLIICLLSNIIFFLHAPKGTANNPFSKPFSQLQQKRLRKVSSILTISAILIICIRTIILFAMLTTAILLIPDFLHKFQASA